MGINFGMNMNLGDFIGTPPGGPPGRAATWANRSGKFVGNVMNSTAGREFRQGVMEQFGYEFGNNSMIKEGYKVTRGQNLGFLGRGMPERFARAGENIAPSLLRENGQVIGSGGMMGQGKVAFAGRLLGIGMLAASAYSGYQENGTAGAVMGVAKGAAEWGAMRAGFAIGKGILANPFFAIPAIGITATYAGYKIGQAAQEKGRRIRNVEMGADVIDRFGTMATIRQRSLNAISNSRVNGRSALGNEAILLSSNYLR